MRHTLHRIEYAYSLLFDEEVLPEEVKHIKNHLGYESCKEEWELHLNVYVLLFEIAKVLRLPQGLPQEVEDIDEGHCEDKVWEYVGETSSIYRYCLVQIFKETGNEYWNELHNCTYYGVNIDPLHLFPSLFLSD